MSGRLLSGRVVAATTGARVGREARTRQPRAVDAIPVGIARVLCALGVGLVVVVVAEGRQGGALMRVVLADGQWHPSKSVYSLLDAVELGGKDTVAEAKKLAQVETNKAGFDDHAGRPVPGSHDPGIDRGGYNRCDRISGGRTGRGS